MKVHLKRIRTRHVGPFATKSEEVLIKDASQLMLMADGRLVLAGSVKDGKVTGSAPLEFSEIEVTGFIA
ncbi:MAG: hypothetical protein ACRCTP_03645 [Aeromonas popoffii]|uniref:hypothetical protein n=1 Tax=Aeromonas popoffii TaxID=70856 RepID=UPI003F2BAE39